MRRVSFGFYANLLFPEWSESSCGLPPYVAAELRKNAFRSPAPYQDPAPPRQMH